MLRHGTFLGFLLVLAAGSGCGLGNPFAGDSDEAIEFVFTDYQIAIRAGHPLGIVALKLQGQVDDFANSEKPLGDWEWFWFDHPEDGQRRQVKLVYPGWGAPAVERGDSLVAVRFKRRNVLERGIDLELEFILQRHRPALEARYTVINASDITLQRPYAMVGFPGFGNHHRISAVATALGRRVPGPPHTNFRAEVLDLQLDELLLLRHDSAVPGTPRDTLSARIELCAGERLFELSSAAVVDSTYRAAYSAHTIKAHYLTSHLYTFFADMPPGTRRTLAVQHQLRSRPAP